MHFIFYRNESIPIIDKLTNTLHTDSKNPIFKSKAKFIRMANLANRIFEIQEKMHKILNENKLIENKLHAYSILMMMETGIRVGNESSADGYVCNIKNHPLFGQKIQTYGLTTLKKEHIKMVKNTMEIDFLGKKAVEQNIKVHNHELIKWGKTFLEEKNDNVNWLDVSVKGLRKFVKVKIGKYFLLKDFRTLKANLTAGLKAAEINHRQHKPKNKREMSSEIKEIVHATAEQLGNTPAICRKSYINIEIINWTVNNRFPEYFNKTKRKRRHKKKSTLPQTVIS